MFSFDQTLIKLSLGGAVSPVFQVTQARRGHILLKADAGQLRVRPDKKVDYGGKGGPWARFAVEKLPDDTYRLKNFGHDERNKQAVYLDGHVLDGALTLGSSPTGAAFTVLAATPDDTFADKENSEVVMAEAEADKPKEKEAPPPAIALSNEQKAAFMRDGFIIVPGAVAQPLVDNALRGINHELGANQGALTGEGRGDEGPFPELRHSAVITDLYNKSGARSVVEGLLGPIGNQPDGQVKAGQIALRFPQPVGRKEFVRNEEAWHIDTQPTPHMSGFNLLVGVALSDQPCDNMGNITIWPGEHAKVHDAVTQVAPQKMKRGAERDEANPWLEKRPKLDPAKEQQVHLAPGDLLVAHQKMPHRVGLNFSPHVRYQCYFRISAKGYQPGKAPFGGLWDSFEGLRGTEP